MSRWTIDVCSTCGRVATWPFCEHRPTQPTGHLDSPSWCEPVIVAPTNTRGRELAKANLERALSASRPGLSEQPTFDPALERATVERGGPDAA